MGRVSGWLTLLGLAVVVLAVAACGGGGSSTGGSSGDSSSSSGGGESGYDKVAVDKILKEATAPAKWTGPKEADPAVAGKTVALIPVTRGPENVEHLNEAAAEAAQKLGWKTIEIDGKGTAQGWSEAINGAILKHVDAVFLGAIAPTTILNPLRQLKEAGIAALDWGTVEAPTEELWIGNVGYDIPREAEVIAASIAKESNGEAKLLLVEDKEFHDGTERTKFFLEDLEKLCPGCEIVEETEMQIAEVETKLAPKIVGILQSNPEINFIFAPFDDTVPPMVQAIKQVNDPDIKIVSRNGTQQSMEFIRNGEGQSATVASPVPWQAWAAMDTLNRYWSNKKVDGEVLKSDPLKLYTKANALKAGEYWTGEEGDFEGHYEELWGLK
jgi:ribose transport system substrate-binding protein